MLGMQNTLWITLEPPRYIREPPRYEYSLSSLRALHSPLRNVFWFWEFLLRTLFPIPGARRLPKNWSIELVGKLDYA